PPPAARARSGSPGKASGPCTGVPGFWLGWNPRRRPVASPTRPALRPPAGRLLAMVPNPRLRLPEAEPAAEPAPAPDRLWRDDDVAAFLAVSPRTVARLKHHRGFPKPVKVGRSVRWVPEEIRSWVRRGSRP